MRQRTPWALAAVIGLGGGAPVFGAYWLDDAVSVYNTLSPSSQSQNVQKDTGEQTVAGPLALSGVASGNGDGGASSSASLNVSADYGALSAQLSGTASNSPLTSASAGTMFDTATSAASFDDQLTVVSEFFPEGYPVVVVFLQSLYARASTSPTAVSGTNNALASVSILLQVEDLTTPNEQTLTFGLDAQGDMQQVQSISFLAHVGDEIELTGMLYVDGLASANDLSSAGVEAFNVNATALTGVDVAVAFPTAVIGAAPSDGITLAGYIAESSTVYPIEVPEAQDLACAMIPMLLVSRRRKKEPPS